MVMKPENIEEAEGRRGTTHKTDIIQEEQEVRKTKRLKRESL